MRGEGEAADEERRGDSQRVREVGLVEGERVNAFEKLVDLVSEWQDTPASLAAERVGSLPGVLQQALGMWGCCSKSSSAASVAVVFLPIDCA